VSTKASKRKEQKKTDRKKRLSRERNVAHNRPDYRYDLQIYFDEKWSVAKRFRSKTEVQDHLVETEKIRKQGGAEIVEGKVFSIATGREVAHIKPFKPEDKGPTMAEAKALPELTSVKDNQEKTSE